MREERSRGRKRHVDIEAERQQKQEKDAVREVFRHGTEQQFRDLMRLLEFSEEEIGEKVKAFRAARAERWPPSS
ncbi:MAG: hypothetical protein LAN64_03670 [Acidobacteriia bacterium]|nr:hypothetical protein [Terriglobia bacterium]